MAPPPSDDAGVTPWATLRLRLAAGPRAPELLAAQAEILSGIGTILAEDPDVGGAETRDPGTLGGATRPELWIYTVPDALTRLRTHAADLCTRVGLKVDIATEVRHDDDWRDAWKQFYRPMVFGDGTLLLRPSWIAREPDAPAREVVLDPGRAFGTGLHESTRLCITALCDAFARGATPARVLDLGCGSGILALAAAQLWPDAEVIAVDDDPEATDTTRENAELNAMGGRLRVITGQLHDLVGELAFDLFVANIRPEVLVPLAPSARPFVAPDGLVILSGILAPERDRVAAAWREAGFHDVGPEDPHLRDGEWHALVCKPVS